MHLKPLCMVWKFFKRKYRAPAYAFNALKTSAVLLQLYCAHESPGELVKMQILIQYIWAKLLQVSEAPR